MVTQIVEKSKENKKRFSYKNLNAFGMWKDRENSYMHRFRKDFSHRTKNG